MDSVDDFELLRKLLEHEKEIKSSWDIVRVFEEEKVKINAKRSELQKYEKRMEQLSVSFEKKKAEYQELLKSIKSAKKRTDVMAMEKEISGLSQRILELELENAKLKLEIKDTNMEDEFKKRGDNGEDFN